MPQNLSPEYLAYIASPEWRKLRDLVLARDQFRCRECGCRGATLDVHHLTYIRLFDERLEDLISLCRPCHEERHNGEYQAVIQRISRPTPKKRSHGRSKADKTAARIQKELDARHKRQAQPPVSRSLAGPTKPRKRTP